MSTFQTLLDSYGDLANRYAALEDENAALKARIAELEAERDALKEKVDDLEFEVITLTTDVRSVESDAYFFKERWEEAEEARNEWFSMYQNLKTRTDNYDFLVYKTREQTEEIYRLVREINKLGG